MKIYHHQIVADQTICFATPYTNHMLNVTQNHYNFLYILVRKNK
ncbi:hypothetical protein SJPD1_0316 [Sulfurospirillum diekertiae]|uniref:Uncharacterized protein n=1 Tax=Sulfurospirillum diekertiae TaxID=1854492 RepID=A0A290HAK5_9BACT|nr:hypothetical protein SJPD1_0316 [Sulfurospirillum diekertiae]